MAKLASHNTMTYLPVRQWYLKPFGWMSKCQSRDILEQAAYTDFFELRIRFDNSNNPVFAHGLAEYKFDLSWVEPLSAMFADRKPYVMVNLEWSRQKGLARQELLFIKLCQYLEENFKDILFCGGMVKYDWSTVYRFQTPTPSFVNYTASTTGSKIDDIWPWLFTKRHNHEASAMGADYQYVRVDYIHTAK